MQRRQFIHLSSFAAGAVLLSGCALVEKLTTEPMIARVLPEDYSGVAAVREDLRSPLVIRASGLALREERQPVTKDTRFLLGAMARWVTAITILRMADMGRLDLDAPISRHLPELPPATGAVTLRQLISNRSGVPDRVAEALRGDKGVEKLEIGPVQAAQLFGSGVPVPVPGAPWVDSPTNWILAAAVVERASKEPFTETVEKLVLAPAGVRDTSFAATGYEDEVGMAVAYSASGQRNTTAVPPMLAANGTLYGTARDLVAIADAVYFKGLLSDKARQQLSTIVVASEDYALGGRVKTLMAGKSVRTLVWITGHLGGYATLLAYDPADGRAVVLLNNTDMPQAELEQHAVALFKAM